MELRADRRGREAFAVLAYSNMLTLNAIIQLLSKKGILTREEILAKVKEIEERMPGGDRRR